MSADDCPNIPETVLPSTKTNSSPSPDHSTESKSESTGSWRVVRMSAGRNVQTSGLKTKNWEARMKQKRDMDAAKSLERELKAEKEADKARRREITQSRKKALAEKKRMEELSQKMSAKRLQRVRKRLERSKKVSG
ncbi:hypothetical protein BT69DRAFT_1348493 [Atractiella rhizophila]|nr:hypothetical protein BT69DRAFT_1348493 [Atractiella rhizophila]